MRWEVFSALKILPRNEKFVVSQRHKICDNVKVFCGLLSAYPQSQSDIMLRGELEL